MQHFFRVAQRSAATRFVIPAQAGTGFYKLSRKARHKIMAALCAAVNRPYPRLRGDDKKSFHNFWSKMGAYLRPFKCLYDINV